MAQQIINVGSTPNDGTGDLLRNSQVKANANFTELYSTKLDGVTAGTNITIDNTNPKNPIINASGVGETTTDALAEGSTNLYFQTARVLATVLTGLSFATGGAIVSTDTVIQAFGKIQKQINDLASVFVPKTRTLTINGTTQDLSADRSFTVSSGVTPKIKTLTSTNLATQDLAGFLTYINALSPNLVISASEVYDFQVTDTGQVFRLYKNGVTVGVGQTAIVAGEVVETRETFLTDFGRFSTDYYAIADGNLWYASSRSIIGITNGTIGHSAFGGAGGFVNKRRLCANYTSAATTGSFSQVASQASGMCVSKSNTIIEVFLCSENPTPITTMRAFSGIKGTSAAITNVDPSTLGYIIGIGNDSGDTNLQIMHNDFSGTATKLDLGASFPAKYNVNAHAYRAEIINYIDTANWLVKVECIITGAKTSRYITTDAPPVTTQMYPFCFMGNGTTATAVQMTFFSWIFKNY